MGVIGGVSRDEHPTSNIERPIMLDAGYYVADIGCWRTDFTTIAQKTQWTRRADTFDVGIAFNTAHNLVHLRVIGRVEHENIPVRGDDGVARHTVHVQEDPVGPLHGAAQAEQNRQKHYQFRLHIPCLHAHRTFCLKGSLFLFISICFPLRGRPSRHPEVKTSFLKLSKIRPQSIKKALFF